MLISQLPSHLSLEGTTALITGAGSASGIGFASARALGELGARVIITGTTDRIHERAEELRSQDIDVVGVVARLETEKAAAELSTSLVNISAQPTIVVNNAGMVTVGHLSVMAVLTALYPAGTIILAAIVLRERITKLQLTGMILALAAAALLAVS